MEASLCCHPSLFLILRRTDIAGASSCTTPTLPATKGPHSTRAAADRPPKLQYRDHGYSTKQRPGKEDVEAQGQWLSERLTKRRLDQRPVQRARKQITVFEYCRAPEETKKDIHRSCYKHRAEVRKITGSALTHTALLILGSTDCRYGISFLPLPSGVRPL